jgi:hypothetical protein
VQPEVLAYWAGVVDGEGSIDITRTYGHTKKGKRPYFFVRLAIYNTRKKIVEDAAKELGCGTVQTHHHIEKRFRDIHTWVTTTTDACRILALLIPYLKIKKDHAFLALEFKKHVSENIHKGRLKDGNYDYTPDNEVSWREQTRQRMKALNK